MRSDEFYAWRTRLGLTQVEAGVALGKSMRSIRNYEGGFAVPQTIDLACRYIGDHPEILVLLGLRRAVATITMADTGIDIPEVPHA